MLRTSAGICCSESRDWVAMQPFYGRTAHGEPNHRDDYVPSRKPRGKEDPRDRARIRRTPSGEFWRTPTIHLALPNPLLDQARYAPITRFVNICFIPARCSVSFVSNKVSAKIAIAYPLEIHERCVDVLYLYIETRVLLYCCLSFVSEDC